MYQPQDTAQSFRNAENIEDKFSSNVKHEPVKNITALTGEYEREKRLKLRE